MASGFVLAWYVDCHYANDVFRRTSGSHPTVTHEPAGGDRGEFLGAYSVVHLQTGFVGIEYMPKEDIEQAKALSKSNGPGTPWQKWYPEMAKKSVVKRHAKRFLPSSDQFARFRRMIDEDNAEYRDVPDATPKTETKYISGDRRVELWEKCLEKFEGDAEGAKAALQKLFDENNVKSKFEITPEKFVAMLKTLNS